MDKRGVRHLTMRAVAAVLLSSPFGLGLAAPAAPPQPRLIVETGAHSAPVRRLSINVKQRLVVTASDDKSARVWDLDTGTLRHVLRPGIDSGEVGQLYGAALHPTDETVAVGGTTGGSTHGNRILLFDAGTGRFQKSIDTGGSVVRHLAWSADGSVLIAAFGGTESGVKAFDSDGRVLYERRFNAPCLGLAVSPIGTAAATSLDGSVLLLGVQSGQVVEKRVLRAAADSPVGVAISPDGSRLLVGFGADKAAPELFDIERGVSIGRLPVPVTRVGNYRSVAWSADGLVLVAAGSSRDDDRRFDAFFFDARSGQMTGRHPVATDSILDLKAIAGRRFAYAAFDGTWGVIGDDGVTIRADVKIADLRGPERLLISPDATELQWTFENGARPASFSFARRTVAFGPEARGLRPARNSSGWTDRSSWQDTRTPVIRGTTLAMEPGEISRALAYFHAGSASVLGTSRRLLHLDGNGKVRWEVRAAGEVRAVNVSEDDRLIVTGMSDGTIRWWRSSDGALLVTLLVTREGQWLAWTESGYYDAAPGADRLAGWAVNRQDFTVADFFSLGRFRERFNRPEVIDQAIRTQQTVALVVPALPPVLEAGRTADPSGDSRKVTIPYAARSNASDRVAIEVRIDGRPADDARIVEPVVANGLAQGSIVVPIPAAGSVIQVMARDDNGVSEALSITLTPPLLPTAVDVTKRLDGVPPVASPSRILRDEGPKPRLFILAIGVSDYQKKEYQLGLPAKDATDFSAALRSQAGGLYSQVIVNTLTDRQATRRAVIEQMQVFSTEVGPRDIGILFFAGHGLNSTDGQYYFLPHDADHHRLAQTGIPEQVLQNTLGRMRGRALLFVDTCFGGAALSRSGSTELARLANNLSATENGVVVFASSSGRQVSEEKDAWGNGAFTKAVLAGLAGSADLTRTGRITFKGLDFYVSEEVRKLTEGRQTPVTISPVGVPDFTLARVGTG